MPELLRRKTWQQGTYCEYGPPDDNNDRNPQGYLQKATSSEDPSIKK